MPFFYKKPTKTKAVVAKLPILPSSTPSSTSTISTISIKVFIIHYKKLVQRKINVINQLKKHGITNFEFIEIDRDELHKHDTRIFATGFANYQQAICLSHFYVYNQIIKNDLESALIFEDDVVLHANFAEIFTNYIKQLSPTFDMLFIGNGCNLHIPSTFLKADQNIYEKSLEPTTWGGNGATRCTDSYVVSKKAALKLCKYLSSGLLQKINLPIDWWLNDAIRRLQLQIYWAEPTIVEQGTQNGLYLSSY